MKIHSGLIRFVHARLSPGGELGLHLTVGMILMLAGAWIFGGIAEDVMSADRITVLDVTLANWLHAHGNPELTRGMLFITNWHDLLGTSLMSLLLAGYFYVRRAYYWLLTLAVTVPGGMLLNVLLKYAFHRTRPTFDDPLVTLLTYSFPSGHTTGATLFYGVLACYLVCVVRHWGARLALIAAAALMVLLVALSRMYLGAHYLSDVLAAMALGSTWLAVCITASSTLRRRRAARADK